MARVAFAVLLGLVLGGCRSPSAGGQGDGGRDGGTAATTPRSCGETGACSAGEYCAFSPALCGRGARPGACRGEPAACAGAFEPVCGCDGKVYDSECAAHRAGVDLDVTGRCRVQVPDWIACGPRFCDARRSYCEIVLSDVFELPSDYTCKTLPAACVPEGDKARECGCFPAGTRCLSFCGYIETGRLEGFHLTCRL